MSDAHVFVRPSTPLDARLIGEIHARTTRASLEAAADADLELADVRAAKLAEAWAGVIAVHPESISVAVEDGTVVGFAATAPTEREDLIEVLALEVDPAFQRRGHGSRLLASIVDGAREAGVREVQTWALRGDDARTTFLSSAGLAPAGFVRSLDVEGRSVDQHCWHASL